METDLLLTAISFVSFFGLIVAWVGQPADVPAVERPALPELQGAAA